MVEYVQNSRGAVERAATRSDKEWRPSYAQGVNPRSETYVRRGSAPQRYLITGGGATAGNVVLPVIGGAAGATVGRNVNMRRDNVRAYRRKDAKKAQGWAGLTMSEGGYNYGGRAQKVQKNDYGWIKKNSGKYELVSKSPMPMTPLPTFMDLYGPEKEPQRPKRKQSAPRLGGFRSGSEIRAERGPLMPSGGMHGMPQPARLSESTPRTDNLSPARHKKSYKARQTDIEPYPRTQTDVAPYQRPQTDVAPNPKRQADVEPYKRPQADIEPRPKPQTGVEPFQKPQGIVTPNDPRATGGAQLQVPQASQPPALQPAATSSLAPVNQATTPANIVDDAANVVEGAKKSKGKIAAAGIGGLAALGAGAVAVGRNARKSSQGMSTAQKVGIGGGAAALGGGGMYAIRRPKREDFGKSIFYEEMARRRMGEEISKTLIRSSYGDRLDNW